jgi:hypothetical protein
MENFMSQRTEVTLDGKTFVVYYTARDRKTGKKCPRCGESILVPCVKDFTEVLDAGTMTDETSPEVLKKIRQFINREDFFFRYCADIMNCGWRPEEFMDNAESMYQDYLSRKAEKGGGDDE